MKGDKDDSSVLKRANELKKLLSSFRVGIDESDKTPGEKFNHWEVKGVPIRIEVGAKELESKTYVVARRDNGKKESVKGNDLAKTVGALLKSIDGNIYSVAQKFVNANMLTAKDVKDAQKILDSKGGIVKLLWCGKNDCGKKMEEQLVGGALGFSVQTKWKAAALEKDFAIPAGKIVYWPNGTDIERFDIPVSCEEARRRLGLPQDKSVALYTGSLQHWKGVETLAGAAKILQGDVATYVVGGSAEDIQKFSIQHSAFIIHFVGQRPWKEIPLWLKAADVLLLPNTARDEESLRYTSPMKLFEYMASGRPVVASDIPSIREIVDETMVFFAKPDDPASFATVILRVLGQSEEAGQSARRAQEEAVQYTWDRRARKILGRLAPVSP